MKQIKLIAMRRVGVIGSQMKQIKHAVSPMKRGNPSGKGNFVSQMKQIKRNYAGRGFYWFTNETNGTNLCRVCRGISPKLSKMMQKNYQYLRQRVQKAYFLQKSAEIFGHVKKKQYLCTRFSSEAARTFSSLIKRTRYNRLPFGRNASEAIFRPKSGGIEFPNDDEVVGQCTRLPNATVHSYIGITPDFGSEKRGSTPRWTTKGQIPP